jgi:hypothetical protein
VLACTLALVLALVAGYFGGTVDLVLSRLMDLIWAFPLYLFAISLATVLLARPTNKPLKIGFVTLNARSLWIPLLIIGLVYVPYVYRPIRGQVLSLREKEFVEAGSCAGRRKLPPRLREILPNVISTVIVLLPLMIATTILTEAALSYLSIGVQSPQASWGTIIQDGQAFALLAAVGRDPAGHLHRADGPARSTSSATACATRSTALEGAGEVVSTPSAHLRHPPADRADRGHVRPVRARLPAFLRDAGVDPARLMAGGIRTPRRSRPSATSSASTGRCRALRADDEAHVHHTGPDLVRQPHEGDPRDHRRGAGDILARFRRSRDLGRLLDPVRACGRRLTGHDLGSTPDGPGPDRDLDSVFWLGEIVNLFTQSRWHNFFCSAGCRRSATRR